jgi:predicted Zn-dependent peptidase
MMRKQNLFWLVMALLMVFAPYSAAAKPPETFKKVVLQNGLTLMYKVMKNEPMVSVYAVLPVGMNLENQKGIAHLIEHLVFRGGSGFTFKDILETTNRQGGEFNGFTSFYTTVFNYVVPKAKFDDAFQIFNGSLWQIDLSEANIALERKIVNHELNMDYAMRIPYYPVFHYFYTENFYSKETVDAMTVQGIKDFYQSYYQPTNVTYVIAGDIDPKAVIAKLENIQNGYGKKEVPKSALNEFNLPRADIVEERNIYPYQYQVLLAYQFTGLTAEERMVLRMLSFMYGTEQKIDYEKNEAKVYNVVERSLGNTEYFGIYYLERKHPYSEADFNELKASMLKFIRQFKKVDLQAVRKDFVRAVEMERASSNQSAVDAVQYEVQRLTDPDNVTVDSLDVLKKIDNKDLERVIDRYLSGPPTTWILVKNNGVGGK